MEGENTSADLAALQSRVVYLEQQLTATRALAEAAALSAMELGLALRVVLHRLEIGRVPDSTLRQLAGLKSASQYVDEAWDRLDAASKDYDRVG